MRRDPDDVTRVDGIVDLRSDTVTKPTAEMRRAMAEAEVGADVYGEDPTVNRLEKRAAEMFGKEAALFVPSGCMGNLISIKVWTNPGDEVICDERSHVNLYELASMSAIAGCMPRIARGKDGILTWKEIEAAIRPKIYYDSQTALVCLENTNNMAGGTVYSTGQVEDICEHAHAAGLKVHLDGARIFNAATALGETVEQMTRKADSVMFCLSKGLGAPVGSLIVGTEAFIEKGRIYRKMFGGGMRQAEGIAEIPGLKIDTKKVRSNIVIFDCAKTGRTATELCDALHPHGVWAQDTALYSVRVVTHCDVDRAGIERALVVLKEVVAKTQKAGA